MKTEDQLRLQAYLDNEVSSSEARQIASWIARDLEAKALYEELQTTKMLLKVENELPVTVPESHDFYWSKIQREIERTEREPARSTATARPWWFRILAPLAGTAALAMLLFTSISMNPSVAVHHEDATLEDGTITFRSKDNSMTLVWISTGESETADASSATDEDEF